MIPMPPTPSGATPLQFDTILADAFFYKSTYCRTRDYALDHGVDEHVLKQYALQELTDPIQIESVERVIYKNAWALDLVRSIAKSLS